jgi:hypothetical protein
VKTCGKSARFLLATIKKGKPRLSKEQISQRLRTARSMLTGCSIEVVCKHNPR